MELAIRDFPAAIRLMRPMQWVKNAFVAAPLFFSGSMFEAAPVWRTLAGVIVFSLIASCLYIINDWRDRESDRAHPKKRQRPLASGAVSDMQALAMLVLLATAAIVITIALELGAQFATVAIIYAATALAYSLGLKHIALLEIFIVAFGYVLRVIAGSALVSVAPSPWLLAASWLIAFLITAGKRRADLAEDFDTERHRRSLQGYTVGYLDSVITMAAAMSILAYILYTVSDYALARFSNPYLVGTSMFVAYGILRYKQLIMVGKGAEDPTSLIMRDPGLLLSVAGWALSLFIIVYVVPLW